MPISSLNKNERVKSRKLIASLFESGNKIRQGPFLLYWQPVAEEYAKAPLMFGVSVSKRKFKRAVDRNAIKRKIREAYRLQKVDLIKSLPSCDISYALFVVYLGQDLGEFHSLSSHMTKLLSKWKGRVDI